MQWQQNITVELIFIRYEGKNKNGEKEGNTLDAEATANCNIPWFTSC